MSQYPELETLTFRAQAVVTTDRAQRYAKQLASHLGRKIDAQEIEDGFRLTFNRDEIFSGYGDLIAGENALLMTVYAATPEACDRVAGVLESHLVRFGERDGLVVEFNPID